MIHATLCFVLRQTTRGQQVLLGLKKRGFGAGKVNGFGGKLLPGESPRAAMSRELLEECRLTVAPTSFEQRGLLVFRFPSAPHHDHRVRVYTASCFDGSPVETDEMKPEWHPLAGIPLARMWDDDALWLPPVLKGHTVVGRFFFSEDNESVVRYRLWVSPEPATTSECSDSISFAR